MKNIKKIAGLLLALVMIFAMTAPAFAADETGSITITNAIVGQTYTVYQVLDLESYDAETRAYSYKAAEAWSAFINSDAIKGVYVTVDDQGYVSWVEGADAEAFAKLAQAYAAENSVTAQGSKKAEATAADPEATRVALEFAGLDLGYYLVDTTMGTLCSLDTTNPDVEMTEKNPTVTIDKEVQEDSTGEWGDENTAEVGDTVEYRTFIYAQKGAQNYVLHDKMAEGLTLNQDSIVVTVAGAQEPMTVGTEYTVAFDTADGCDFEITFAQSYLDTITAETEILVTYDAVLNENAVVYPESNNNDTKLDWGEENSTEWDTTKTYTFKFDLVKTNDSNELLEGAKFELYTAETEGEKIALVKEEEGVYRIATDEEIAAEGFESAVIEGSQVLVKGMDANTTYWLEETEAPAGYNKLAARVKVEIKEENLDANVLEGVYQDGGVHVINKAGTELPETGGIGTTIFYVLGGILVLAAVVLLVTKKRMSEN